MSYETVVRQVLKLPEIYLEQLSQYILMFEGVQKNEQDIKFSIDDFVGVLPQNIDCEKEKEKYLENKYDTVH